MSWFCVTVTGTQEVSASVMVEADTPEQAQERALRHRFDWHADATVENVTVTSVENAEADKP